MLTKINLGCGEKYLPGYINCDISGNVKTDKLFDLNKFPYPFKSDFAEEVLMDNVLEHVDSVVKVMEEVYRVLKQEGILRIYVPYAKSDGAVQDPTHTHFFTENSMNYFSKNNEFNYYTDKKFTLVKAQLFCANKTTKSKVRAFLPFKSILKYFLFNIYDGVYFELKK